MRHSFAPFFSRLSPCSFNITLLSNSRSSILFIPQGLLELNLLNSRLNSMAVAFGGLTTFPSSSVEQAQPAYDVFINHRGPDTKRKLASTIYNVLLLENMTAFLDTELELGDHIPRKIEDAMCSAQVHIAILSETYVKSPWCLEELLFMQEHTQALIIPVFYYVEPAEFRRRLNEDPKYVEIFSKHEERYPQRVDAWKRALQKIANVKGKIVMNDGEDEGVLLKTIVSRVRYKLMKVNVPLDEPGHLVGMGKAIESFETFLKSAQVHDNVKVVGIVGMSGCGKTALARKFYNLKYSMYNSYSFLSDVRNVKLTDLQRKLLWDLVHLRDKSPFAHASELKPILASRFKQLTLPVLIVLDNVDGLDQLDNLLPEKGRNLGSGSLIIVTTHNRRLLEPWGVSVYPMEGLDQDHAEELFSWHAFLDYNPPPAFQEHVKKFVKACDRFPLFIEVVAGMLYGKSEDEWRSKLNETSRLNPENIRKLRPMYDALGVEEKYIFLDVACFFVGENINLAITVWEADGSKGQDSLDNLVNKCLVKVDKKNRIRMNDILRDLGKKIAMESWPPRLCSPYHLTRILERTKWDKFIVRGIMAATTQLVARSGRYEFPECCDFYEPPFQLCMDLGPRILLKLLVVAGDSFKSNFAKLSADLVWLRWFNLQDSNVPSWLSVTNLRVLELYGASSLQDLWENNVDAQPPKELREMIITATEGNSFRSFPSQISGLMHLTKIALISYPGEEFGFKKLPDEFCQLKSLEHLELRQCANLSTLPICFGDLCKLRHLDFFSCKMLRKLPHSFKELVNLEYLNLSGCEKLSPMPEILENMRFLKKLYFSGHTKLKKLPLQIVQQKFLRKLHLRETGLQNLPDDINQLRRLEKLVIGSPHLTGFPESLGYMSSLKRLIITKCMNLESLPESIQGLKHLEYLFINSCEKMRSLPEGLSRLSNLQYLKIIDCQMIAQLDFRSRSSSLHKLKVIHLKGTSLTRISFSQDCCPNLEILQLEQNYSLRELVNMPKGVKLVNIPKAVKIVGVDECKSKKRKCILHNAEDE